MKLKDKIKQLYKPTDESIIVELFKDKATVSVEKSLHSRTILGRKRYSYRVISKFTYVGEERTETFLAKSPQHAIAYAEKSFEIRNRQTIKELSKGVLLHG